METNESSIGQKKRFSEGGLVLDVLVEEESSLCMDRVQGTMYLLQVVDIIRSQSDDVYKIGYSFNVWRPEKNNAGCGWTLE